MQNPRTAWNNDHVLQIFYWGSPLKNKNVISCKLNPCSKNEASCPDVRKSTFPPLQVLFGVASTKLWLKIYVEYTNAP